MNVHGQSLQKSSSSDNFSMAPCTRIIFSARHLTQEEESDLQSYLDSYKIEIGDVSTFEARLREEIFNLEVGR